MSLEKPPWPIVGGVLDEVNASFHSAYGHRRRDLAAQDPVLVFMDHSLIFVWDDEQQRFPVSPQRYHEFKSVAHAPVAAFCLVHGTCGRTLLTEERIAVTQLRDHAQALEAPGQNDAAAHVIAATVKFLNEVIGSSQVDEDELAAFARAMGPVLLEVTDQATAVELAALHEAVERAMALLPPAKHAALQVVVVGEHQARERSLPMQYFRRRLGEAPGAETRVAYAEGISTLEDALALVGTRRFDRVVAAAFFGDAKRLQRDVLGDAAKARLDASELQLI